MLLRKAAMADVEPIRELINAYAAQGLMLPKARSAIYENIREYVLAEEAGQVVGVGGLHILWHDLAEVRSLAVAEKMRGKGIGRKIVSALEEEAKSLGVTRCFAVISWWKIRNCPRKYGQNVSIVQSSPTVTNMPW